MLKKITLFTLLFCVVTIAKAQQRGFKDVNVTISGAQQTLYKQSHALVIGISDYTAGWPDLPGVKNDIAAVKTALEKHDFDVTLLENATKEQIDKSISSFISKYGQEADNRLLFYFAGHGHTVKTSYGDELGYIVPVDAPNPNKDAAAFQEKAIEMVDFEKYAKRIQSKHALFLFDACFSGSLFALSRAAPEIISYKTSQPVRQFITSGSANETVPDVSIFRKQFVTAMNTSDADANKDGYLTCTELGDFLQTSVVNYSYNTQHPQYGKIRNPNLDKGDFVFVLNKTEEVLPAATGSLQLITGLSGKFYIDAVFYKDVSAGSTYTFSNIPSGVRVLSISGTVNWTEKVAVISGQTTTVSAKKEVGIIELYSEISGSLYIDKVLKKSITANSTNTFSDISAGVHPLKIEGAQPWAENVYVSAGQTVKVTANKVEKTGSVNIASQIDGKLYIDDVYRQTINTGSSSTISDLSEGQHTAKIKDASTGQELWSENFEISKGQTTYLTAKAAVSIQTSVNYTETASGVNIDMVFVKGGSFMMGSPTSETDRESDEVQHSVSLSDYYIGKYEITVGQFKKFIDDNSYRTDAEKEGWSYVWTGSAWEKKNGATWKCDVSGNLRSTSEYDHPVIHVSWNDAKAYCAWLSAKTGKNYGLPTEAQWEYACRAGTTTPFITGNCLSSTQANYNGNYPYSTCSKGTYKGKTVAVGSYSPNAWGLYDMHGNVWEWCSDWYGIYSSGSQTNPTGPSSGSYRVNRGGSWNSHARHCRSAYRRNSSPDYRGNFLGFRLVCVP